MNQPQDLADKIKYELENNSFKHLISRFRNIQHESRQTKQHNAELQLDAAQLSQQLRIEIERRQHELNREKSVTSELHKLLNKRRDAQIAELNALETKALELSEQVVKTRETKLDKLQYLAKLANSNQDMRASELDHSSNRPFYLSQKLPLELTTQLTAAQRWQRVGLLVEAMETEFVPITQKYPQIKELLLL